MDVQQLTQQISEIVASFLPRVALAIAILVVGWIVAKIAGAIVRSALGKTTFDNRLAAWLASGKPAEEIEVEKWAGKGVFYLVMLFVAVAVFEALGLTILTEPLSGLLTQVFVFAPRVLSAAFLLGIGWALATGLRLLVTRALEATQLESRLSEATGEDDQQAGVSRSIGDALYWFVILLFLPGALDALALEGMLLPVQDLVAEIVGFLPNLLTAAVTLLVGWFLARVLQRIVTSVLAAVGLDALAEKAGIAATLGTQKLSRVCGTVIYVFVFIPILISALSALQLEMITAPLSNMLNMILGSIPSIFAAILVLLVAYALGRVVAGLVNNLLAGIGFNAILAKLGLGKSSAEEPGVTPSSIVQTLVLVAIMLFAATEAAGLLGFAALSEIIADTLLFAGDIAVGLVIMGLGLLLANLAATAVLASAKDSGAFLSTAARVAILALTGAMALRHMGLANEIITLAFGLTLGAVAVAAAIAFGLGGREAAAQQVQVWRRRLSEPRLEEGSPSNR